MVPVSTMRPASKTRMRVARRTVASRCATTNVVRSFITSSSAGRVLGCANSCQLLAS